MATYVVGDIQGCIDGLEQLLKNIKFSPKNDRLWAVGDLVARGSDSLATLEFLFGLGDSFSAVLGNHDLHLLAVANGIKQPKPSDNLKPLLNDSKLPIYVDWLRQFPLAQLINDNTLLVHAGLYPLWSVKKCLTQSSVVSKALKKKSYVELLKKMYGSDPKDWSSKLSPEQQQRFTINACTRMRFLTKEGSLEFSHKEKPSNKPSKYVPWFEVKNQKLKKNQKVIFGHWASLEGLFNHKRFVGLDTGYVWGGKLTAFRLEDQRFFSYNKIT